ncbi:hypothetical protein [Streptomyces sp. LARHCF252]
MRALWAYMCRWATTERLLLDALAALGPGLLVLWADNTGASACERMTAVKGRNDPRRREPGTLRDIAGSPNRVLTMLHCADDAADVVRELGVLCSWAERSHLIKDAATCLYNGQDGGAQHGAALLDDDGLRSSRGVLHAVHPVLARGIVELSDRLAVGVVEGDDPSGVRFRVVVDVRVLVGYVQVWEVQGDAGRNARVEGVT